jgi:hypothetical protein
VQSGSSAPTSAEQSSKIQIAVTVTSSAQKEKATNISVDSLYLMPATTYAPTHLARAVPSALRGLTSGMIPTYFGFSHSSKLMLFLLGLPGA